MKLRHVLDVGGRWFVLDVDAEPVRAGEVLMNLATDPGWMNDCPYNLRSFPDHPDHDPAGTCDRGCLDEPSCVSWDGPHDPRVEPAEIGWADELLWSSGSPAWPQFVVAVELIPVVAEGDSVVATLPAVCVAASSGSVSLLRGGVYQHDVTVEGVEAGSVIVGVDGAACPACDGEELFDRHGEPAGCGLCSRPPATTSTPLNRVGSRADPRVLAARGVRVFRPAEPAGRVPPLGEVQQLLAGLDASADELLGRDEDGDV